VAALNWTTPEGLVVKPLYTAADLAALPRPELADTLLYLVRLADRLNIDLASAASAKIELNEKKYPVEMARGNARKYTEFVSK